jgi:hypothetical protein
MLDKTGHLGFFIRQDQRLTFTLSTGIPHMNSPTGVNIRGFPAFLQDRRSVRPDAVTSATFAAVEGSNLAILADIWTHSSRRLLLNA